MAINVEKAVKLTDKAVFPLAKCDIKFEILPPGQAATKIIPNATLGVGCINDINKKVTAGKIKNCENIPISMALGFIAISLKCSTFISKATPNITRAKVIFIITNPDGEKFKVTSSKTCKGWVFMFF